MVAITQHLVQRISSETDKLLAFFHDLAPDQWAQTVYSGDKPWTIQQILAHLASAEIEFTRQLDDFLAGGLGAPEGFDIDAFNAREVAALGEVQPIELMRRFEQARRSNIEKVSRVGESDLARQGRHPYLGIAPLSEIVKMIYRHNQIHLRDIRRVLNQ